MLMFLIPFTNKNDHVHKRARKFNTQGPKINGNLEGINSTNIYRLSPDDKVGKRTNIWSKELLNKHDKSILSFDLTPVIQKDRTKEVTGDCIVTIKKTCWSLKFKNPYLNIQVLVSSPLWMDSHVFSFFKEIQCLNISITCTYGYMIHY